MSFRQTRSPRFNNPLDVGPTPQVSTQAASGVGTTSATGNGMVISFGANPITARGFVYSSSNSSPTLADSVVIEGSTTLGAFAASIGSLTSSTVYYYAAYATNGQGTGYGQVLTFMTSGAVVTSSASTFLMMGVG